MQRGKDLLREIWTHTYNIICLFLSQMGERQFFINNAKIESLSIFYREYLICLKMTTLIWTSVSLFWMSPTPVFTVQGSVIRVSRGHHWHLHHTETASASNVRPNLDQATWFLQITNCREMRLLKTQTVQTDASSLFSQALRVVTRLIGQPEILWKGLKTVWKGKM